MTFSFNRNQLKYLAVLTMLLDHIAWAFVPTATLPGQLLHAVGRFTAPTMLFFLAEGYIHTRSVPRYAGRLFLFALLSWPPFSLFEAGTWPAPYFGMIYTMFLGLIGIRIWDRTGLGYGLKLAAIVGLCALSFFGDWYVMGVLWPLFFFIYHNDERKKWTAYIAVALCFCISGLIMSGWRQLFQFGALLPPLLLRRYNGEPGSRAPFHKWFFYVFYPGHLLLLWWLQTVL